jgi:hypothetical protein
LVSSKKIEKLAQVLQETELFINSLEQTKDKVARGVIDQQLNNQLQALKKDNEELARSYRDLQISLNLLIIK